MRRRKGSVTLASLLHHQVTSWRPTEKQYISSFFFFSLKNEKLSFYVLICSACLKVCLCLGSTASIFSNNMFFFSCHSVLVNTVKYIYSYDMKMGGKLL